MLEPHSQHEGFMHLFTKNSLNQIRKQEEQIKDSRSYKSEVEKLHKSETEKQHKLEVENQHESEVEKLDELEAEKSARIRGRESGRIRVCVTGPNQSKSWQSFSMSKPPLSSRV